MSAPAASGRELIAFQGAVHCRAGAGPVSLVLHGWASGGEAQVLFCGTEAPGLPAELHDVRIRQLDPDAATDVPAAAGAQRWRIDAHGTSVIVQGRSVQVHRDAAAAFFGALPAARVPARLRLGWAVLLTALRFPGAARLLTRLRGSA